MNMTPRLSHARRLRAFEKKINSFREIIEAKENSTILSLKQNLDKLKRTEQWLRLLIRDGVIDVGSCEPYQEALHYIEEEINKQLSTFQ